MVIRRRETDTVGILFEVPTRTRNKRADHAEAAKLAGRTG
jgi:hypothetical protein